MNGSSQSILHPSGIEAEVVSQIWWIMLVGATLTLLLVTAILLYALFRAPERRLRLSGYGLIIAGGVVLPVVSLSALLIYSLDRTADLRADHADPPHEIEVIGHQWWWEVRYLHPDPQQQFTTANELHLPVGKRTRVTVSTADVIHSFWVPNLAGKIDLIPGMSNQLFLEPTQPGVSRGQCAEFCGAQHARMAFYVVAESPQAFESWRQRQLQPAAEPRDAVTRRGQQIFLESACAYCHTVRGTPAGGGMGPDLTHVGSRLSLAAGTLEADRANLAAWVVHAQTLKPDSFMPSFRAFTGEQLQALTTYLESLE